MPPSRGPAKKTRSRKRKARTEASSSSSSSSSSASDPSDASDSSEPEASKPRQNTSQEKPSKIAKRTTPKESAFPTSGADAVAEKRKKPKKEKSKLSSVPETTSDSTEVIRPVPQQHQQTPEDKERTDFENWYVRTVTRQYADDLTALRTSSDFRDASVPVLVRALRQGAGALMGT